MAGPYIFCSCITSKDEESVSIVKSNGDVSVMDSLGPRRSLAGGLIDHSVHRNKIGGYPIN